MSTFNFSQLSMREIATIEELSGQPIGTLSSDEAPKGRALAALAYTVRHREDPTFTWNDAQDLTMSDVSALINTDETVEPDASDIESDPKGKPAK